MAWRKSLYAGVVLPILLMMDPALAATTRYVGSCGSPTYASINLAIAAAASGDTIAVCAGTYSGGITVDRPLTIKAADGTNDVTIAGGSSAAITIAAQSTGSPTYYPSSLTLTNLTLTSTGNYGIFANSVNSGSGTYALSNVSITSALDGILMVNPGALSFSSVSITSSGGNGMTIGSNAVGPHTFTNTSITANGVGMVIGGNYGSTVSHTLSSVSVTSGGDAIQINSGAVSVTGATIHAGGNGLFVNSQSTRAMSVTNSSFTTAGNGILIGVNDTGAHVFTGLGITCTGSGCFGIDTTGGATFSSNTITANSDAIHVDHTAGNSQTYSGMALTSATGWGINVANSGTATSSVAMSGLTITSSAGGINFSDTMTSSGNLSFNGIGMTVSNGTGINTGANMQGSITVGNANAVSVTENATQCCYGMMINAANNVTITGLYITAGGGVWLNPNVQGNVTVAGTSAYPIYITSTNAAYGALVLANTNGNAVVSNLTLSVPAGFGLYAFANASVNWISNFSITSANYPIYLETQPNSLTIKDGTATATGSGVGAIYLGQSGSCQQNKTITDVNVLPGSGGIGLDVECGQTVAVSGVCTTGGSLGMFFDYNAGRVAVNGSYLQGYTTSGIEQDSNSSSGDGGQNNGITGNCFETSTVPMGATPSYYYNANWNGNFWKGVTGSRYQPGGTFNGVNSYSNGVLDTSVLSSCPAATVACYSTTGTATPVGDWYLDEASWSGTTGEVKDAINSNNGAGKGSAQTSSSGKICGAGSFNGSTAYVTIPNSSLYNVTGGTTFSAWVYPTAYATAKIFEKGDWNGHGLGIDVHQGFFAGFYVQSSSNSGGDGGNASEHTVSANVLPTLNTWYHVVGVYDGTSVSLYINGVLAGTQLATGTLSTNSYPLTIGSDGGTQKFFPGMVDEALFYNVALTAAQVQALYANQSAGLNWDGSSRTCSNNPANSIGSFASYETATAPASAYTGNINTKVAGVGYSLDVAALDTAKTAVNTGFSGAVLVQVIGSASATTTLDAYGCPASSPQVLASPGTITLSAGRSTVAFPAEANAWPYAKVKVSYPASNPTVVSCSGDAFAIRPSTLSVVANDSACTASGSCWLNNGAVTGTPVHAAGAPFTLTATGYNGAATAAITTNYPGPTSTLTPIGTAVVSPASVLGSFATGSFTGSNGSLVSTSALYSEVGSLTTQLRDASFAAVDASESATPASGITSPVSAASCSGYYVCSPSVTLGRFVPSAFTVTPQALVPGCASTAPFTYFGQGFSTPFVLNAVNASGAVTQNYAGTLAKLGLGSWSNFTFSASGLPSGFSVSAGSSAPTGSWSAGVASVNAAQIIALPSGTVTTPPASVSILAHPTDTDGVTVASATAVNASTAILAEQYGGLADQRS